MRLESAEAAHEGLTVSPLLLSHILQDEAPEESVAPRIGDEARLFHWRHDELFSESEESCSFLVWRTGGTLSATFVSGGAVGANDRIALELAKRQQRRIEAPSPFTAADFDDGEVGLENPALRVPVYWLGKQFGVGRGLPTIQLERSFSWTRRGRAYLGRVDLDYSTSPGSLGRPWEELFISSYSRGQWRRLAARGRTPGVPRCDAIGLHLTLPQRQGTVFHGYEGNLDNCRKRGAPTWTLRVRTAGLVIIAQTSEVCALCARSGTGPYNSLAGMTAIARGLERRAKTPVRR
jgi:hypothetical protein